MVYGFIAAYRGSMAARPGLSSCLQEEHASFTTLRFRECLVGIWFRDGICCHAKMLSYAEITGLLCWLADCRDVRVHETAYQLVKKTFTGNGPKLEEFVVFSFVRLCLLMTSHEYFWVVSLV